MAFMSIVIKTTKYDEECHILNLLLWLQLKMISFMLVHTLSIFFVHKKNIKELCHMIQPHVENLLIINFFNTR